MTAIYENNGQMEPKADNPKNLTPQKCPNIFHKHRNHEWGEKGKVYWCSGEVV